ncbi:hypothetical protein YPPY65_0585, partial [Yersinia pestis PY-65]
MLADPPANTLSPPPGDWRF